MASNWPPEAVSEQPASSASSSLAYEILDTLCTLSPAEFDIVVYKAGAPEKYLSSPQSPQATRAVELLRYLERRDELEVLLRLLPAPGLRRVPELPFAFTSRRSLFRRLEDAASRDGAVLIGLQGVGGSGKTTLAAEFARRHVERFSRIAWVDVRGGGGLTLATAEEVLVQCGARRANIKSVKAALEALSPSAERAAATGNRLLIVLDNADHPDESFASFADHLALLPGTLVVVTTRDRAIASELGGTAIEVARFTEDEARECLRAWLGGGVRAADQDSLREVAHRVGELPLAVRLAGAFLRRHPELAVADYAGQLPDLPGTPSLAATFEITRSTLTEDELRVFAACCACAPDVFTANEVANAAAVPEEKTHAILGRLCDASLIDGAPGGFVIHPLLREVGCGLDIFVKVAGRHADRVLALAGPDHIDMDALQPLHRYIVAAIENTKRTNDSARLIALSLRAARFWRYRGPWDFANATLARAISAARGADDLKACSMLLYARADILQHLGQWDDALHLLAEKHSIDRIRDTPLDEALALSQEASIRATRGELDRALELLEHVWRLQARFRESNNAIAAETRWIAHDMKRHLISCEQYIAIRDHAPDGAIVERFRARAATGLVGQFAEIEGYHDIADVLQNNDDADQALTMHNLGVFFTERHEFFAARKLLKRAIVIRRRLQRPIRVAETAHQLGRVYAASWLEERRRGQGRDDRTSEMFKKSELFFAESLYHAQATGAVHLTAENQLHVAKLQLTRGRDQVARVLLEKARRNFEQLQIPARVLECMRLLDEIEAGIGSDAPTTTK